MNSRSSAFPKGIELSPNLVAELGLTLEQRMELQKSLNVIAENEIRLAAESLSFVDQWVEDGRRVYQFLLPADETRSDRTSALVRETAGLHLDERRSGFLAEQLKLGVSEFFGASGNEMVTFEVHFRHAGGVPGGVMDDSSWIHYFVIEPDTGEVLSSWDIRYEDLNVRLGRNFSFPFPKE